MFTCTNSERIERATLYGLSQRAQLSLEKKEKRKKKRRRNKEGSYAKYIWWLPCKVVELTLVFST